MSAVMCAIPAASRATVTGAPSPVAAIVPVVSGIARTVTQVRKPAAATTATSTTTSSNPRPRFRIRTGPLHEVDILRVRAGFYPWRIVHRR